MNFGPVIPDDDADLLDQTSLAGFRRGPGEIIEAQVFWRKGVPRLGIWRNTNPTPEDATPATPARSARVLNASLNNTQLPLCPFPQCRQKYGYGYPGHSSI